MDSNLDREYSSWLQLFSPSIASAIRRIDELSVTMTRITGMLLMTVAVVHFLKPNSVRSAFVFAVFITGCFCGVLAILSQSYQALWRFQFQLERTRIALPPLKIFKANSSSIEEETTGSKDGCVVCLEEFKNGELVQAFPMCNHEFHAPCINTWLNGGKTTCPICRFSLQEIVIVERIVL